MGRFLPVLVVVGAIGVVGVLRARRRTAELRSMAVQFGLAYSPLVAPDLPSVPFPLFSRGDKQRWQNLLSGRWGGIELREFDLAIVESDSDGSGGSTTWFSCAVTEIPAWCETLTIKAETLATRVASHLGAAEVPFESEQFDRTFSISCHDPRFASAFVDARMMAWLLAHGRGWTFEVTGRWVLCYRKLVRPQELIPLLGTLRGFCDHIPRVVSELYGVDAPR
jgi:hypothetical protein